jgi:hypothetical protein
MIRFVAADSGHVLWRAADRGVADVERLLGRSGMGSSPATSRARRRAMASGSARRSGGRCANRRALIWLRCGPT